MSVLHLLPCPQESQELHQQASPNKVASLIERNLQLGHMEELVGDPFTVNDQTLVQEVVKAFEDEARLSGAIVTREGQVICIISQVALAHRMARGYFKELFLKRTIAHMLPVWESNLLVLPHSTSIHDAINQGLSRPPAFRYEPIVVVNAEGARFLIDMHLLLSEQCLALSAALEEVARNRESVLAAQRERDQLNERLLATSRQAGMAEVATSVLHNVGNVLNSVTVSTNVIGQRVRESKVANLSRAIDMIQQHREDLPTFFKEDEKGRQLPGYLAKLAAVLSSEHTSVLEELTSLSKSVEHIQHIVTSQQAFASSNVVKESFQMKDAIADALRINALALNRHGVKVIEKYDEVIPLRMDKHKVLQILVNLINNAKKAVRDAEQKEKQITIRIREIAGSSPRRWLPQNVKRSYAMASHSPTWRRSR